MCGEQLLTPFTLSRVLGSSPRVRGADGSNHMLAHSNGIIPACAGSSWKHKLIIIVVRDHPRVCGEQTGLVLKISRALGSSPRVRGAVMKFIAERDRRRIIPACAGSSRDAAPTRSPCWDHPRVCGEQPEPPGAVGHEAGSSPRVRGAGVEAKEVIVLGGIIPACAGSRDSRLDE